MFVAGMSGFDVGVFGILSMFVAVFSAIKVFTWVATLYRGRIRLAVPMLYFFLFLFLFGVGGTSGVALASTSLDIHWHDTYFVVAHFHYVMVGATLTGLSGRLHYWWPKITGRTYPGAPPSPRGDWWGVASCSRSCPSSCWETRAWCAATPPIPHASRR